MSKRQFDAYLKAGLVRLLPRFGSLEVSSKVPAPPKEADGWFLPGPRIGEAVGELGLLGELIQRPCVLEPYSQTPSLRRVQPCFWKQTALFERLRSERRGAAALYPEADWPRLVLFFPRASPQLRRILAPWSAVREWPLLRTVRHGVYCSPRAYRTLLVVSEQLPETDETLFVRLLFSDLKGIRAAWRSLRPEFVTSPVRRELIKIALDYWRHIEAVEAGPLEQEEKAMAWRVPELPRYMDMEIEAAVKKATQELEVRAQQASLRAEEESRRALGELRRADEAARLTVSTLVSTRFPGLNGEQPVIERYLLSLGLPEAARQVLTRSLPELLDAALHAA